ncbi:MAG: hypothetical protein WCC41_12735 [Rhodomicrobium sp.]
MSWDYKKYFAKAQLTWLRIRQMEHDNERYLLEVSFFCEYMIRGVLVRRNPTLNAAPDEESLMHAAGLASTKAPRSIPMEMATSRVNRLIPDITDLELKTITGLFVARNGELHGDSDEICGLRPEDVMPKILSFMVRMAADAGQNLADIMGTEDAAHARDIAVAEQKGRQKRVKELIRIQKDRFFGLDDTEQKKRREEAKPKFVHAVTASSRHLKAQKCPACANMAILGGNPIGKSSPFLRQGELLVEVRVQPDHFECKCCELVIKGLDELLAGDFPHEFVTKDSVDPIEHLVLIRWTMSIVIKFCESTQKITI